VHVIIRGLRAFSDFENEFQMALTNRQLAPDIETIFLMPKENFSYISSSAVREIVEMGGDARSFVPDIVQRALERKVGA
jgi:pantetheine-phosphate adenylyltransferase